jgi:hypothetical protein
MGYIASFVILFACVKLLGATHSPGTAAGVFVVCKVLLVLFLGGGILAAIGYAAVMVVLAFGYFWLLDRSEGSALWWVVLLAGVLLLA